MRAASGPVGAEVDGEKGPRDPFIDEEPVRQLDAVVQEPLTRCVRGQPAQDNRVGLRLEKLVGRLLGADGREQVNLVGNLADARGALHRDRGNEQSWADIVM